jgi:hypothetical protein
MGGGTAVRALPATESVVTFGAVEAWLDTQADRRQR